LNQLLEEYQNENFTLEESVKQLEKIIKETQSALESYSEEKERMLAET
jgi:hypothetical protein